jgi:hypothetical protein
MLCTQMKAWLSPTRKPCLTQCHRPVPCISAVACESFGKSLAGSRLEVRESIRAIAGLRNTSIGHLKLNRAACWPHSRSCDDGPRPSASCRHACCRCGLCIALADWLAEPLDPGCSRPLGSLLAVFSVARPFDLYLPRVEEQSSACRRRGHPAPGPWSALRDRSARGFLKENRKHLTRNNSRLAPLTGPGTATLVALAWLASWTNALGRARIWMAAAKGRD